MAMNEALENSVTRFDSCVKKLDAAIYGRKQIDDKVEDLLRELQILRDDRIKLAGELDSAKDRISSIEVIRSESLRKINTIIDNVRMVIDMDKFEK